MAPGNHPPSKDILKQYKEFYKKITADAGPDAGFPYFPHHNREGYEDGEAAEALEEVVAEWEEKKANKGKKEEIEKNIKKTVKEKLAPLKEIFFDRSLMDELIICNSIPNLLEGTRPSFRGSVLYGPPGTGKSEFQKSVCEVYKNCGAYSHQAPLLADVYIASFAKNLEKLLKNAQKEGEERKLPSFVAFDEGTSFVQSSKLGADSSSKYYQEAIDTLKKYVGNECGNWLVLSVSTNEDIKNFEGAVIRDGRLKPIYIGPPSSEQLADMWKFFLNKYEISDLNQEQAKELADFSFKKNDSTIKVNGSFIEEFSRTFLTSLKQKDAIEKGYSSLLDSLFEGYSQDTSEIKKSISYPLVFEIFKYQMENHRKPDKQIGFQS